MILPASALIEDKIILFIILGLIKKAIINSGAIFCHVARIRQFVHLIFSIIVGNQ